MFTARLVSALDRLIGRVLAFGCYLALPIAILLFLQWPLRDLMHAYSREANDIGQWLFALYVAMAVTAATRADTHLATDVIAGRYPTSIRKTLSRLAAGVGVIPWALYVAVAGKSIVLTSISGLEAFPDTANPGYFLIKIALWVLAGLMLAQGLVDVFGVRGERHA
jgi:TRAP-type mannitol/chloroaromatic compound transport system permease small subunit